MATKEHRSLTNYIEYILLKHIAEVESENGEISTCHAEEAIIDRIMISRAKQVLVVADSTKIGRTGFSYVSRCDDKIKILTNKI